MLETHNQFILSRILPDGTKLPVDASGRAIDAHDPANWLSYENVLTARDLTGYLPAFVITENDPFFLLDIDDCLIPPNPEEGTPARWSELAVKLTTSDFAGAMIEISRSGRGLHVIGSYSGHIEHSCRNEKDHIELYTRKRFVILGHKAYGNASLDCTVALRRVVNSYFPPRSSAPGRPPQEWTFEPVDEWSGPDDDEELIALARSKVSVSSVFRDDPVTFDDLWTANASVLAKTWPSERGEHGYDASSADMSLAQRLAYYTGRNCQRIYNIMRMSGLNREKWDLRPDDYLRRTILTACHRQERVYADPARQSYGRRAGEDRRMTRGWVDTEDIPGVFRGCVYVVKPHAVLVPGYGTPLRFAQFDQVYSGFLFALDDNRTTRKAHEGLMQCPTWGPPIVDDTCFKPSLPFGAIVEDGNETYVNTFRPLHIRSRPGNIDKFLKLMEKTYVEKDREILFSWIAALIQNIGVKVRWAPLLQGPEGNGKSFVCNFLRHVFTRGYTHSLNARDIEGNGSKFTQWMYGKLLIVVEDIRTGMREEITRAMLGWISDPVVEIQAKGEDQETRDNHANFLFTSNFFDALHLRDDQRRFCPIAGVLQTGKELEDAGLTPLFFKDLYDWAQGTGVYTGNTPGFEHMADFFLKYGIQEQYNPLGQAQRAPRSHYYDKFVKACLTRPEQEILEAIEQQLTGFRNGWVSSIALDNLLQHKRLSTRISRARRIEILTRAGYMPHPGLNNGRATFTVMPDGARPRLFIREGHVTESWTNTKDICNEYQRAQNLSGSSPYLRAAS